MLLNTPVAGIGHSVRLPLLCLTAVRWTFEGARNPSVLITEMFCSDAG